MTPVSSPSSVTSLARVTELWLTRDDPWRSNALLALQVSSGLPSSIVEEALHAAFEELTAEKLDTFYRQQVRPKIDAVPMAPRRVLHIAAGNVFTAWLHGAVITLLMGHDCWIKPSSVEMLFPRLWKESLERVDPLLSARVAVVPWREALLSEVDAVIAYGTDETLARLRSQSSGRRFIGFGHQWSLGIVFREAIATPEWPLWRDRILTDIRAFRLAGCLSPQVIYVQGGKLPWDAGGLLPVPMPKIQPFETLGEVQTQFKEGVEKLSCLGVAGSAQHLREAEKMFGNSETLRTCFLGEMQRPPLNWRNGGVYLPDALSFGTP